MTPQTPVTTLPFIGSKYQQLLLKLGIQTVSDLLYHLPRGYQDLSKITPIEEVEDGVLSVIEAELLWLKKVRLKNGKLMFNGQIADTTGKLKVAWFNQSYIDQTLKVGQVYRWAGEVELQYGSRQMISPQAELASRPTINTGRLVPIYDQTAGVSSKWLRARIEPLLSKTADLAPEYLPDWLRQQYSLLNLPQALRQLHHPADMAEASQARARLAFNEMLLLQILNISHKRQWQSQKEAPLLNVESAELHSWLDQLPFQLTPDQLQVTQDILQDLTGHQAMNRLVQGDVGSGKTIVAFLATLAAVKNGYQAAILAPTSVLAQQHYQTFQELLKGINPLNSTPSLALRTAKSKANPADITIGTHALLNDQLDFSRLGLAIIDEQHRFGVNQRSFLLNKADHAIHTLTMTATPIPRTLSLTVFGDLDVSTIASKPANRLPVKTHIVPQAKRQDMYSFIQEALDRGEQAYIICPLVEDSENLQVKSATQEFERLQKIFPNHNLALLHGRMKATDKDIILNQFKNHDSDILVATPVVEVGIDVPNATILVIEGAERFGLAQLHQLRGRVGRGSTQSYCFLLSDAKEATDIDRLQHMTHHDSGIELAEIDLQQRGPGEVYGTRQSGIPALKAASYFDLELIEKTRQAAEQLITNDEVTTNPTIQAHLTKLTTETN